MWTHVCCSVYASGSVHVRCVFKQKIQSGFLQFQAMI